MLFSSLTRRLGIPPRPARRPPKPSFRPRLEALEDRVVPAAVGYSPSVYTSYESIRSHLQSLASDPRYAGLVELERIGEGAAAYNDPTGQEMHRGLWAIRISDILPDRKAEAADSAAEPDVKYIGNMHGNEPLSMQMCMGFIDDLLMRYATDSGVQNLVNNNEIWVLPSMNPDGLAAGTRANANGYDLNRSFPDLADGQWGDVMPGTATMSLSELEASLPKDSNGNVLVPEVKAVMDWSSQHHFELAANFHTGNVVVNYPYDDAPGVASGQYAASPDDALYRQLSKNYVDGDSYMAKRSKFVTDGVRGITNGSAWFRIHGGMQDFDYRYFDTKHVTVELYSGYGFLSSKNVDQQWAYNKPAMFDYLSEGLALLHPTTTGVTSAQIAAALATSVLVSGGTVLSTTASPSTVDTLFADPSFTRQTGPAALLALDSARTTPASDPAAIYRSTKGLALPFSLADELDFSPFDSGAGVL